MKASITAVARYLPERVLTNKDLEQMVETTDEWILSRTGISERRIVSNGEATSHLGVKVAREILHKSHTDPREIDCIIVATVTPDMLFPATACLIQHKIKATKAWGFDLSAACSGFLFALETGRRMIESGKNSKILIIGADTMSCIVDYQDRNTCILFGDGAGGVLLEPSQTEYGIIDSLLYIDGSGADLLKVPGGGSLHPPTKETIEKKMHFIQQEGKQVFKFAVKGMTESALEILKRNGLTSKDLALFIPHQANRRIIDACAERLNLHPDQVVINIDKYANTNAATIPIGISEAVEQRKLSEGDYVLLGAFGAGFTWGSILIRWSQCA